MKRKKVKITVQGGVANVEKVPAGVVVEIEDLDNDGEKISYIKGEKGGAIILKWNGVWR